PAPSPRRARSERALAARRRLDADAACWRRATLRRRAGAPGEAGVETEPDFLQPAPAIDAEADHVRPQPRIGAGEGGGELARGEIATGGERAHVGIAQPRLQPRGAREIGRWRHAHAGAVLRIF